MRESGGRFVLMDFGAGRFSERHSTATRAAGTPLYLAPEVLQGDPATVQSDIYALGVLLYLLVTGSYPVQASSIDELIAAHVGGQRRNLRDARPDLPDSFVEAVERALEPDPRRRFATAGDMLAVFTRADFRPAAGQTSVARQLRTSRVSRGPLWQALAALVCLMVLGGALAYWWSSRPNSGVAHAAVQLIAVLPFDDLSGSEGYLADGLTEALTQELSTAGPLKVSARTSVGRLVAQNLSLPQIAESLNADAVIEGSILKTGSDVRVNVRVIQAGSNAAMWASTFERTSSDLAVLQRDCNSRSIRAHWNGGSSRAASTRSHTMRICGAGSSVARQRSRPSRPRSSTSGNRPRGTRNMRRRARRWPSATSGSDRISP
jgi:TolB-like protein